MNHSLGIPRITIAIPSYNRVSVLQNSLREVASALPPWVKLLIVDNASDPAIGLGSDLENVLAEQNVSWRISRNTANIGGGPNIIRCFEEVDTDWFLLCGDDDIIDPVALQLLQEAINVNPDAAFIKCSSRFHNYKETLIGQGTLQLIDLAKEFGGLLFMSSFVFNRRFCMPHLRYAYLATSAYAPQVAIALLAAKDHPFVLSSLTIARANEHDPAWSPVDVVLSSYQLTDLPIDQNERTRLINMIYRGHNVGRELMDIVSILRKPSQRAEGFFLRRKAIRTHMFFGSGAKRILALIGLLVFPYLGNLGYRLLVQAYLNRTGRSELRTFRERHTGL